MMFNYRLQLYLHKNKMGKVFSTPVCVSDVGIQSISTRHKNKLFSQFELVKLKEYYNFNIKLNSFPIFFVKQTKIYCAPIANIWRKISVVLHYLCAIIHRVGYSFLYT